MAAFLILGTAWSDEETFTEHPLMLAPEYPCTWPSHPFPRFPFTHQRTIGGFYCMLGPKHQDGPNREVRAFSIVGRDLPGRLIDSCRNKRAVDLSPTLSSDLPQTSPGIGTGKPTR